MSAMAQPTLYAESPILTRPPAQGWLFGAAALKKSALSEPQIGKNLRKNVIFLPGWGASASLALAAKWSS
ncbi:hypothetical protein Poly51_43730 [Rubripirellula tenax]|uniref:Uncharacterized protein n=1 Tax=Rubripirellula tenax TaxID=2528015 RepID=A0A5C6EUE4_9BACT|nr:hypothetical protein Poly51_43730 [Rubripirellula tenax]